MVAGRRGVVFDLDDTLYLERDYVRSGYHAVADAVAAAADEMPATLFEFMWRRFASGERVRTFNALLTRFPRAARRWSVAALVDLYRQHVPSIKLGDDAQMLLDRLVSEGTFLGIVSDGFLATQRAKVEALDLDRRFDHIVLTDQWGNIDWKPGLRGFRAIENASGLARQSLTYVGDNPAKDFIGPNHLGWNTVRLRVQGQLHAEVEDGHAAAAASMTVRSLDSLCDLFNVSPGASAR